MEEVNKVPGSHVRVTDSRDGRELLVLLGSFRKKSTQIGKLPQLLYVLNCITEMTRVFLFE